MILLVALFALGLLLGTRFTAYVLLPASLLVIAADLLCLGASRLTVVHVLAALFVGPLVTQVGYCVGYFCRLRIIDTRRSISLRFGTQ